MVFFVLVLLAVILIGTKIAKPGEFQKEYISKDSTNVIKGIFVVLILLSHGKGYIEMSGLLDGIYLRIQWHLNQMVVAMFLFYSGYGMMEQIKKRGSDYVKSIATKRFPNLLLNYDIAIILFVIMNLCLNYTMKADKVLLAFVAWTSIRNSNWYIFVILVAYIFTFLSFLGLKKYNGKYAYPLYIGILTVLMIGFVFILKDVAKTERFWYNTAILFALGFWYSYFKDGIEKFLMKNDIVYVSVLAAVTVLYVVTFKGRSNFFVYEAWAVLFTLLVVMVTMKVRIESNILQWFGEHVFSIYILQRLPMILLYATGLAQNHKYVYLILSYLFTILISIVFDKLTGKLSALIWKPKQKA